jgi:hypothetical protein
VHIINYLPLGITFLFKVDLKVLKTESVLADARG